MFIEDVIARNKCLLRARRNEKHQRARTGGSEALPLASAQAVKCLLPCPTCAPVTNLVRQLYISRTVPASAFRGRA